MVKMEKKGIGFKKELKHLLEKITEYNPNAHSEMIKKAFEKTDEYSFAITKIILGFKADSTTIISSLLWSPYNKNKIKGKEIENDFGKDVLNILEGISKIGKIKFKNSEAENIRKMIFAMSKDVRIILIKLAERLQTMRELKKNEKIDDENKKISEEIINIYAPIAYKLGIYSIKSELEDLSLYFIDPKAYNELKKKISLKKKEREKLVSEYMKKIQLLLEEKKIDAKVVGRAKSFYSIYRKMKTQKKKFEEILDLIALRVITQNVDDCYRALGAIHSKYTPIISEFYDYIANPKPNMYQSIHTKILMNHKPVEVQIRTLGMHQIAEEGIAAHWRYKDTERDKLFDKKIAWMKQILEWKNSEAAKEFIDSLKIDLFKNEIITLTPQGDPISLPEGSTPIDFAYYVHTEIGNSCEKAKVNGQIVSLDYKLQAGDVVEIITSKKAKPSRQWLRFVKTTFAKSKIRDFLNIKGIQLEEKPLEKNTKLIKIEGKTKEQKKIILKEIPHLARCCSPRIGDKIIALITKDSKIHIHKADCKNLNSIPSSKKLKASWKKEEEKVNALEITLIDRTGILSEILNIIAQLKINLTSINSVIKKEKVSIILELDSKNSEKLENAILKIKRIKGVISITKK